MKQREETRDWGNTNLSMKTVSILSTVFGWLKVRNVRDHEISDGGNWHLSPGLTLVVRRKERGPQGFLMNALENSHSLPTNAKGTDWA